MTKVERQLLIGGVNVCCCHFIRGSGPQRVDPVGKWHGPGTGRNVLGLDWNEHAFHPYTRSRPKGKQVDPIGVDYEILHPLIGHTSTLDLDHSRTTFAPDGVHSITGVVIEDNP